MVVGVVRMRLQIPENQSLKGKRRVLKQIIERTRNRFAIAIAETDMMDRYQDAELGFATVGNDSRVVNSVLDRACDFIESIGTAVVTDCELELMNL
jgi:uncharacterized protein YlxP (DUF503 family)